MLIRDIRKCYENIDGLMNKKLPVKMGFAVQKNAKKLQEVMSYAANRQQEILDQYAVKDDRGEFKFSEDGKSIELADANSFGKEMTELEETDIEIEFSKFNMTEVERCDEDRFDSLSPNELNVIEYMIEE